LRVERVIAAPFAVLKHEAIAARCANALNDRGGTKDARLVITGHRLVGLIHDALIGHAHFLALGKALEGEVDRARIGGRGVRRAVETGKHHRAAHTLDGQDARSNVTHHVGAFQRGARGQLHDGEEIALILRRDEARRRDDEHPIVAAISAP
jgi:hypothetical protein